MSAPISPASISTCTRLAKLLAAVVSRAVPLSPGSAGLWRGALWDVRLVTPWMMGKEAWIKMLTNICTVDWLLGLRAVAATGGKRQVRGGWQCGGFRQRRNQGTAAAGELQSLPPGCPPSTGQALEILIVRWYNSVMTWQHRCYGVHH